ncbi:DsbA family protein [Nitrosomonas sp.]|uniref:DsbA family protein n=1 Tax=Nitrosomonas sp. TaxID=42353 RepID=UPI00374CED34
MQTAYYQQAKNPSLPETLQACAREIGLNEEVFIEDLRSPAIESELQHQMQLARSMDAYSYPSLRLVHNQYRISGCDRLFRLSSHAE